LLEGEKEDLQFCRLLANQSMHFPPMPAQSPIEVTMKFNRDGMIEVTAKELNSGVTANVKVQRAQGMNQADLEKAEALLAAKTVE
jgi:molecular chaperone HscA